MNAQPSTNGPNGGRSPDGTFAKGNAGGPGNPHARRVAALRAAMLEAVTEDDLRVIIGELVDQARAGNLAAIKELLDRIIGRAVPPSPIAESGDAGESKVMTLAFDE